MNKRKKTNYPGVFYREAERIGTKGVEKVFYIVFKQDGKLYEEKVGRQYANDMTPARAARVRAERIERKRLSRKEIRQQNIEQARKRNWDIDRLWEEYVNCNPQLKGLRTYKSLHRLYIGPAFGHKEPHSIAPLDIDRMRVTLLKTRSPQTVQHALELLRRIINFGVQRRLCKGLDFKIKMPKVDNVKTEDLSPDELTRLLSAIEQDNNTQAGNMMKFVLYTGMRRSECFRLKWEHVDFRNGFINIIDPKGGKNQKIPLNEAARELLHSHTRTDSPYVFPGKGGGERKDIRRGLARIKKKAGLPKDFRPLHGLRHVYASMLASSGKVDMYTLQKLLTHKSPQMTMRYAHLRDDTLRKASNLAGSLVKEVTTSKAKEKMSKE